jgi:hypothetical protein
MLRKGGLLLEFCTVERFRSNVGTYSGHRMQKPRRRPSASPFRLAQGCPTFPQRATTVIVKQFAGGTCKNHNRPTWYAYPPKLENYTYYGVLLQKCNIIILVNSLNKRKYYLDKKLRHKSISISRCSLSRSRCTSKGMGRVDLF